MEYNSFVNKSLRRVLIYAFFGLFFVLGAGTVFYAQGYRLDLKTLKIVKVGAIYVHSSPTDTTVSIDGKKEAQAGGLFNSGVLVQGLFPKTYTLGLKADGYLSWERRVSVAPSLVTEVNAVLLPEKNTLVAQTSGEIFSISGGSLLYAKGGELFWQNAKLPGSVLLDSASDGSTALTYDGRSVFLVSLPSANATRAAYQKLISTTGNVVFDSDPNQFLLQTGSSVSLIQPGGSASKIFSAAKQQKVLTAATSKNLLAWATERSDASTSTVWIYKKFFGSSAKVGDPLPGMTVKLKFSAQNILAVLQDDGALYLYDPTKDSMDNIAKNVLTFAFSPTGNKLAILGEKTLEVYTLGSTDYARLNLSAFPKLYDINWYQDEKHLFVKMGSGLGLLDLSALSPEDIQNISSSANASYDPVSNTLYYEESGQVWRMDLPK